MRNGACTDMCSHSEKALGYIEAELKNYGVYDYRFCVENDCYVCDKFGNLYAVCRRQHSKNGNLVEKYGVHRLLGSVDKYGYITYRMTVDGIKKHLKAHRIMLNAWVGEKPDMSVNHMDGNKKNNALENLEWCTVAENNAHAIKTGLLDPYNQKGHLRKIPSVDWISLYILYKHCGYSYSELGRMNGCTHDTIKRIVEKVDRILPKEVPHGQ